MISALYQVEVAFAVLKENNMKLKLYIDGENEPNGKGWIHVKSYNDLVLLLGAIKPEEIKLIYFGKNIGEENSSILPSTMFDCAYYLVSHFYRNKPLPECTVKSNKFFISETTALLRSYSSGYGYQDLVNEIN